MTPDRSSEDSRYTVIPSRILCTTSIYGRHKTVVPEEVRKLLNLTVGDKVVWEQDLVSDRIYVSASRRPKTRFKRTID